MPTAVPRYITVAVAGVDDGMIVWRRPSSDGRPRPFAGPTTPGPITNVVIRRVQPVSDPTSAVPLRNGGCGVTTGSFARSELRSPGRAVRPLK
jgi:hypothetical protein